MQRLLLATTSKDKIREYRQIFADFAGQLLTPDDLGVSLDVAETGATFAENAELKARAWHARTGLPTLAEDSGLEIDALGGAPGVYSARWGGEDYATKHRSILERLADVPEERRTCRYVCAIALADCSGRVHHLRGTVEGRVAREPRGTGGFGYDPIFYLPELGRTMAELTEAEKHAISHRGRAGRQALALVQHLGCDP